MFQKTHKPHLLPWALTSLLSSSNQTFPFFLISPSFHPPHRLHSPPTRQLRSTHLLPLRFQQRRFPPLLTVVLPPSLWTRPPWRRCVLPSPVLRCGRERVRRHRVARHVVPPYRPSCPKFLLVVFESPPPSDRLSCTVICARLHRRSSSVQARLSCFYVFFWLPRHCNFIIKVRWVSSSCFPTLYLQLASI